MRAAAGDARPGDRKATGLGGDSDTTMREWWWLGYHQKAPVDASQWCQYEPAVQYQLSASLAAMRIEDRREGLVLDLAPFTDPPSPYQVWRGSPFEVTNTNEGPMLGKLAIAGYSKELWDLPLSQMPPSAKHGRVVAGFYQIRTEETGLLEELKGYLTDPNSPPYPLNGPVRRRVVLLIEIERPAFMFAGVDRFRKRRPAAAPAIEAGENDSVPPGEAVFQWWWGDPNEGGVGHWKNYHPHVSARLEQALQENEQFRSCGEAVPIDEVRYSLLRISRERPFDFVDQSSRGAGFREPFLPAHRITVDFGLYDQQARATSNCFVQFQRGNPKRRRPVRRIRRGEAAGLVMLDGDPCSICFSESGMLTGCEKGHIVCGACLRAALRILVGDVTQTENLVCGCLQATDTVAFEHLAKQADESLQVTLSCPPDQPDERREFDVEMANLRRAFSLAEMIPQNLFQQRMEAWYELVKQRAREHLYHACSHPGCGMQNWMLRTEFDEQYRSKGLCVWTCKLGHRNCVLPSQEDIDDMNRNLLLHPEHYTQACGFDTLALRRFRLCPGCVQEGLLTFAVHEDGCKQWPGVASAHRHCFCFFCTRQWGREEGQCHHGAQCADPGIQQVRRAPDGAGGERLEIGHVAAAAYIDWIKGAAVCPPTEFPSGRVVLGETRQGVLGLENRAKLKKTMERGTR